MTKQNIRMKIYYLIILVFSTTNLCFARTKQAGLKNSNNILISDNLSNRTITAFVQDKYGYIWIGTERGLNKYNGLNYHHYLQSKDNSNTICNDHITSLFLDKKENLWIGTHNGIYKLEDQTRIFKTIQITGDQSVVQQITSTIDGTIYANLSDGIYRYFPSKKRFSLVLKFDIENIQNLFFTDSEDKFWLISRKNIRCYSGNNEFNLIKEIPIKTNPNLYYAKMVGGSELWTMHDKGNIHIIDTKTMTEKPLHILKRHPVLSKAIVTNVFKYKEDQYMLVTHKNGTFLYNKTADVIISHKNSKFPLSIPNFTITKIFKDKNNNIWIGTKEQGIRVYYKSKNQFNKNSQLQALTHNKSVKGVYLDKNKKLWLSTINDDLFIYDINSNQYKRIDLKSFFYESPYFQHKIVNIVADEQYIWLLTESKILCCTYNGNRLIRHKTYDFKRQLYQFVLDKHGKIWVSTSNEDVIIIDIEKKEFQTLPVFNPGLGYNSSISQLSNGNIIIAASNQIPKIINPKNFKIESFNPDNYFNKNSLEPTSIYEDFHRNIWIGNCNGALIKCDPSAKKVKEINIPNVTSIIEDKNHNIWAGTLYGLGNYIIDEDKVNIFYSYDGIGGNQFNENCCLLPDGSIALAATHGLTVFNSSEIRYTNRAPLYFEYIKINNEPYEEFRRFTSDYQSKKDSTLDLEHDQNTISIMYVALDFSEYSNTRYYYKLENYDNDWVNVRNNNTAHYTNLGPGNYTFKVKATNNDNSFIKGENAFKIRIIPSIWFRWYAFLVYSILSFFIVWIIFSLYSRMKKNKEKALLAIREKEQEAYFNNMNMNFFSNISHEFRTPLTIISAPINTLIKHLNLSKEDKSLFHLVQRNIKRMLRLVNQLMDLSKLEADTLKLEVSQLDIIHQIKETLEMYIIYAKEKRIIFETEGLDGTFYMMTDSDKLEKILGNILSNALKYTPAKGVIKLKFDIISNEHALQIFPDIMANNEAFYAFIQIEDSGPGIPEDKLEDIFLRYYQIDNKQKAGYNWGTGIGLYYTKQLLLLHHGKIKAENSPNGGALFSFILPADSKAYSPNEIGVSTQNPGKETLASSLPLPVELPEKEKNKHNKTILIVDDDIEISFYLNQLLTSNYNVINKYDGEEAFNALPQIKPDLIVSDILMPGMNGYELCQKIKKDISFCHIPVILLTAKTLMEEQIKGFHTGANAYVTKPFKPEILLALIDSQLKNKQLLSDFLMSNTSTKSETDNILSPKDKNFMDRLYALMEEELDNPEMNIARIAERLQMSRTKFYHKIKGLTGENPNTLIKKYKLNRASEFLVEGIHNISEIAELTGFVSLSHFSVSFKKQFNCKPSEFKG